MLINGMDKEKMVWKEGMTVPILSDFTFTANDKMILRQFECGSEPCVMLSKFYQINGATSHETLFVTVAYLSLVRETSFAMFDDISHTDLSDLKSRKKTVYVLSSNHVVTEADSGRNETPMDPCIELFQKLYADDMEVRCGLTERPDFPCAKLPSEIAIALLLNPMYGGMLQGSGDMIASLFKLCSLTKVVCDFSSF